MMYAGLRARELGGLLHGALLDTGDARRHADHHARVQRQSSRMHLRDEVLQHLLADLEVGDDAVLERPDGLDVRGRAPDHPLGFGADGEEAAVANVDRDDRRLVEHDAAPAHVDDRVGRAQIDGHVAAHELRENSF